MVSEVGSTSVNSPNILVIDDDPLVSIVVRRAMDGISHRLSTALDASTGLSELEKKPDLIVLDNLLPDGLGIDVLNRIHEQLPNVPVLFVTARGSGSTAIEAMKLCAFDYLPKPLDPIKLRAQINRALSLSSLLQAGNPDEADEFNDPRVNDLSEPLVGECVAMQNVFKAVGKVAQLDVPVLVRGEHGTGRESIAREVHRHSRRCNGPFVKLSCAGVDEPSLEKQLFGEYLPSDQYTPGALDRAADGTLLIEDISQLSLVLQTKLINALRDKVYYSVNSEESKPVPCRIIGITSSDLEALVRRGEFRSDLYYTMTAFIVTLPPLRQRHGDIPLLINDCLKKLRHIAQGFGIQETVLSEEANRVLCKHTWPGNIDELESVLKRALVEQKGHILEASDIQKALSEDAVVTSSSEGETGKHSTDWTSFAKLRIDSDTDTLHSDAIEEMERKLFSNVLSHTSGNQTRAAKILGITRASLRKKLRLYGMSAQQPTDAL